jgi:predicted transcriptional regulator
MHMRLAKPSAIPTLVRLDSDLKAELDRFREEEGMSATWIVNKALREWVERYHEPLDRIKRHIAKEGAKRQKESAKEEREWQRLLRRQEQRKDASVTARRRSGR